MYQTTSHATTQVDTSGLSATVQPTALPTTEKATTESAASVAAATSDNTMGTEGPVSTAEAGGTTLARTTTHVQISAFTTTSGASSIIIKTDTSPQAQTTQAEVTNTAALASTRTAVASTEVETPVAVTSTQETTETSTLIDVGTSQKSVTTQVGITSAADVATSQLGSTCNTNLSRH